MFGGTPTTEQKIKFVKTFGCCRRNYNLIHVSVVFEFADKGNPYDNACIESFHSMHKKKEIQPPNLSIFCLKY
ncbi:MAG: helix-turn-helix domain-containing protein [Lachnospiraceae bacterium]|nr:helix-turn-helix domain-containing protein [Lachnospiraceae bacterium]